MELELTLDTFAYGGNSLGRAADGRAVFVPFALPGERVRVQIIEEKKGYLRGELLEILSPSPDRVEPRCTHFFLLPAPVPQAQLSGREPACGGCQYQHLNYEKQLIAKTAILRDQLQRIGKIEDPPLAPMVPSPHEWNYRNHMQFHLTLQGQVGFVEARGRDVFPISECHLPQAAIDSFWPQLSFESNEHIERVALRVDTGDELLLMLESDDANTPELEVEADVSVVHLFQGQPLVMAGSDHLSMRVLDKDFRVSATSFFQVNTEVAEKMVAHIVKKITPHSDMICIDVYCGVGLFSKFFAPLSAKVIGIESSESACSDFEFNLDEFENVDLYQGPAEEVLPHLNVKPDVILVDPPRAGLDVRVLDAIVKLQPRMFVYVSCDPSTLARDAARLVRGGFQLIEVAPFDLFPQTYHIESISIFQR